MTTINITQGVPPVFQGYLAQGFVLGMRSVSEEYSDYLHTLSFVLKGWSKQGTAGYELDRAHYLLGNFNTKIAAGKDDRGLAQGFVLGVLAVSPEGGVVLSDVVKYSRPFILWADQFDAMAAASRELCALGLISIDSITLPVALWRLRRSDPLPAS